MLGPELPEAVSPGRGVYLTTFSHLLIVNKLLSLSLSLSLSLHPLTPPSPRSLPISLSPCLPLSAPLLFSFFLSLSLRVANALHFAQGNTSRKKLSRSRLLHSPHSQLSGLLMTRPGHCRLSRDNCTVSESVRMAKGPGADLTNKSPLSLKRVLTNTA